MAHYPPSHALLPESNAYPPVNTHAISYCTPATSQNEPFSECSTTTEVCSSPKSNRSTPPAHTSQTSTPESERSYLATSLPPSSPQSPNLEALSVAQLPPDPIPTPSLPQSIVLQPGGLPLTTFIPFNNRFASEQVNTRSSSFMLEPKMSPRHPVPPPTHFFPITYFPANTTASFPYPLQLVYPYPFQVVHPPAVTLSDFPLPILYPTSPQLPILYPAHRPWLVSQSSGIPVAIPAPTSSPVVAFNQAHYPVKNHQRSDMPKTHKQDGGEVEEDVILPPSAVTINPTGDLRYHDLATQQAPWKMATSYPLRYHGVPPPIPVVESQSDVAANVPYVCAAHPAVISVFPNTFTQAPTMERVSPPVLWYRGSPPPPPLGYSLPPEFEHDDLIHGKEEQVLLRYPGVPPLPPQLDAHS